MVPNVATKAALVKLGYAGNNTIELAKVVDGKATALASGTFAADGTAAVKVKIYNDSGSHRFKIWVDGTLAINTTDSTIPAGGVAFAGYDAKFDNCKIGYDVTNDDDIDDPTDDLIWNESWGGGTSKTLTYDHAGNMIEGGTFRYVYDAWNRLVAVKAAEDGGAVTIQANEFDATGRRIKKTVTNAGDYDKTEVYYFDGQRICQINNGSGAMVQQFIHGTQYIDEVVMTRVKDKGDLYVHQDANWNVIGTTDLGRHVVERSVYTPYGELTVHQDTGFGDRDGDQDVDSTDKGTVGVTCTGTVSGSCRILDLDFDGDYDSTDATKFDALTQGAQRHPGRPTTATSLPFAHQGLLFEPELAQYQNRARQYDPGKRRFAQRDPLELLNDTPFDGSGDSTVALYSPYSYSPLTRRDPDGLRDEGNEKKSQPRVGTCTATKATSNPGNDIFQTSELCRREALWLFQNSNWARATFSCIACIPSYDRERRQNGWTFSGQGYKCTGICPSDRPVCSANMSIVISPEKCKCSCKGIFN